MLDVLNPFKKTLYHTKRRKTRTIKKRKMVGITLRFGYFPSRIIKLFVLLSIMTLSLLNWKFLRTAHTVRDAFVVLQPLM